MPQRTCEVSQQLGGFPRLIYHPIRQWGVGWWNRGQTGQRILSTGDEMFCHGWTLWSPPSLGRGCGPLLPRAELGRCGSPVPSDCLGSGPPHTWAPPKKDTWGSWRARPGSLRSPEPPPTTEAAEGGLVCHGCPTGEGRWPAVSLGHTRIIPGWNPIGWKWEQDTTPMFPVFPIFLVSLTFPSSRFQCSDNFLLEGDQK